MMEWRSLMLLLLSTVLAYVETYKILVYNPKFAHSHQYFLGCVADELVKGGHQVTSLIPVIDASLPDGPRLSHIVHVPPNPAAAEQVSKLMSAELDFFEIETMDTSAWIASGEHNTRYFVAQCRSTLQHPGLLEQLRAENYDVLITEPFDYCGIGISKLIGAKSLVTVSSTCLTMKHAQELGLPVMPAYNPFIIERSEDVHSFWWRLRNIFHNVVGTRFFSMVSRGEQKLFDEIFGAEAPQLTEVAGRAAFTLVNSDPVIDFAVPTLTRIVHIGGIAVRKPSPLNKEWNATLSLRPRTILVSFGSIAKSVLMKIERKRALLEAYRRFPDITFIWKYENPDDEFAKKEVAALPNVVLSKWMPQNDLLNDSRIAAFISHGGMASVQEVATRGVPAIFVPIFGDQTRNAAAVQNVGSAILYDKRELSDADKLSRAIKEILQPRYSKQAKRIAKMIATRPNEPREQLLKHVEWAAEFGEIEGLKPLPRDLGLIQLYYIDVGLFLFGILIFAGAVVYLVFSRLLNVYHFVVRSRKHKSD